MGVPKKFNVKLKGHMTLLDFLGLLWPKADAEGLRSCLRWCRFYHAREVLTQLLKEKRASMRERRRVCKPFCL